MALLMVLSMALLMALRKWVLAQWPYGKGF